MPWLLEYNTVQRKNYLDVSLYLTYLINSCKIICKLEDNRASRAIIQEN